MAKHKYKAFFALIVFMSILFFTRNFSIYGNKLRTVKIGKASFRTEEVSSLKERTKGLGKRKKLCKECAMLFVFPEEKHWNFWMKGMEFGLDIIWIKGDEIVGISKNIPNDFKDSITSPAECGKVLEINSGLSDKYGFQVGDNVMME